MSQTALTLTVRSISAAISIIDIRGEISAAAADMVMNTYGQASRATTHVIILNFTHLTYMNSSGIGLLVTLLIRARQQHLYLFCYGLSDHYRHIFDLTRLSDMLKIYTSEDEALAHANLKSSSAF